MVRHPESVLKAAPILLFTLLVASCAPFGTSREERIQRFEVGLNENREYLYLDFYEPLTTDYAVLQSSDVSVTWDIWFPPGYPDPGSYTVEVPNASGDVVEALVYGPDSFAGPKSLRLHMVRDGLEWYLERLVLDGSTIVD
ncbi:MAG: hypothetical protein JW820_07245 [Spirochaetales bacterium]|nr:hypothetical protein [Spirochaetales bacterium]